jgi:molybdopterin-guanine dinucleotide biosynthesis protein A
VIARSADAASIPRAERVAAAVLTGGRGERIGENKANVLLAGNTLAGRAIASLRRAGLDPFIVTKPDRPVDLEDVEVVFEPEHPRHPLAGVAAAIRSAGQCPVIVLACDLPLLPPAFFEWLAEYDGGTVIPCPGGEAQPLAGRYSPSDLEAIESALERQAPARQAAAGLGATFAGDEQLSQFGDPAVTFMNINTPEDLSRAEDLLQR